jgi:hypothetical protein
VKTVLIEDRIDPNPAIKFLNFLDDDNPYFGCGHHKKSAPAWRRGRKMPKWRATPERESGREVAPPWPPPEAKPRAFARGFACSSFEAEA